ALAKAPLDVAEVDGDAGQGRARAPGGVDERTVVDVSARRPIERRVHQLDARRAAFGLGHFRYDAQSRSFSHSRTVRARLSCRRGASIAWKMRAKCSRLGFN